MFTGRIFPSVKLRVSVSQLITLMIAATETPAGSLSVSRSRSLTIRSLHYAKVNKKRKSARADIVEIDDKEPESKDEDDVVADPRGWTQLKSKNLTLEEILDLESDKEVYSHKNIYYLVYLHCLLCPCPLFIHCTYAFQFWNVFEPSEHERKSSIPIYNVNRYSRMQILGSSSIYTGNGRFYFVMQVDIK